MKGGWVIETEKKTEKKGKREKRKGGKKQDNKLMNIGETEENETMSSSPAGIFPPCPKKHGIGEGVHPAKC